MGSWLPVPAQYPASARAKVRVSSCFHLAVPALQPGPWQTGPPPSHTHGPQDVWDKPPWEHQHRRGRGRWCPVRGQGPGRAARGDGAVGFYLHVWGGQSWGFPREQERQKEPRAVAGRGNSSKSKTPQRAAVLTSNRLPLQRHPWDPRPFPGPADFHGNEEGRWAPHDCPPSPSWDDREDRGGPEDFFREGWHRVRGEMGGGGGGGGSCVATPSVPPSSPAVICYCSLVPGTPDPSLALPTSMGMRRTGDGQPTTMPRHPLGMTEKTTKDLRSILERSGTR